MTILLSFSLLRENFYIAELENLIYTDRLEAKQSKKR